MSAAPGPARARVLHTESSGTGYFDWQVSTVAVRDCQISLHTKPGMPNSDGLDVGAALLAETIQVAPGDRVLDLNCGAGLAGSLAALLAGNGQVYLADSHAASVACARKTVEAAGLSNAVVYASSGTRGILPLDPVDVACLRLPKGRHLTRKLAWDAFQALGPGGRFYLAGGNREGIKPALEMARDLFGEVAVTAYRKGFRVAVAHKESASPAEPAAFAEPWLDGSWFHEFSAEVRGKTFHICTRPGIFSWDRLDPGTEYLIETLDIPPGARVLDLGCGYGIIGAVAAHLAGDGQVLLADADVTAVEAAGRTLAKNELENGKVLFSDCGEGFRDLRFDVVATNPPFHQGKETTQVFAGQFIADAAGLLAPAGLFYLVANRFLPYEKQLEKRFGAVERVHADGQYKVLLARQPGFY